MLQCTPSYCYHITFSIGTWGAFIGMDTFRIQNCLLDETAWQASIRTVLPCLVLIATDSHDTGNTCQVAATPPGDEVLQLILPAITGG